jgi:hypothetical protein
LREYLGLPVPFYLHAWCIPRPDTRKFAAFTALLHWFGVFLNAVGGGVKGKKSHRRFGEGQSLSGTLKINDVGKFIGKQDQMIIAIACRREYRLQVNGDEDSYFIAKLLYRNSEVGKL